MGRRKKVKQNSEAPSEQDAEQSAPVIVEAVGDDVEMRTLES